MRSKYWVTDSKSLAWALNYMGYNFYQFGNKYSFIETDDLLEVVKELSKIKGRYNTKINTVRN